MRSTVKACLFLAAILSGCVWDVDLSRDGGDQDVFDAYDAGGDDAGGDDAGGDDATDAGCVPADAPANPDTNPDRFPEGLTAEYILGLARNFPDAALVEEVQQGEVIFYRALDAGSNTLGYAFVSGSWGWCGMVMIITGVRLSEITIRVEPVEFCWGEWIYSVTSLLDSLRCIDLDLVDYQTRDFGPYDVDAVSGATITSDAILDAFWQAVERHAKAI